MTQHKLISVNEAGVPFVVSLSYDLHLNCFHCVVVSVSPDLLYSNLEDENAGTKLQVVRYYEGVLERLGVKLPDAIYKQVESDQLRQDDNRRVVYNQDGSVASESTGR